MLPLFILIIVLSGLFSPYLDPLLDLEIYFPNNHDVINLVSFLNSSIWKTSEHEPQLFYPCLGV